MNIAIYILIALILITQLITYHINNIQYSLELVFRQSYKWHKSGSIKIGNKILNPDVKVVRKRLSSDEDNTSVEIIYIILLINEKVLAVKEVIIHDDHKYRSINFSKNTNPYKVIRYHKVISKNLK